MVVNTVHAGHDHKKSDQTTNLVAATLEVSTISTWDVSTTSVDCLAAEWVSDSTKDL